MEQTKFTWYFRRLLAMGPAEIVWRCEELTKRIAGRWPKSGWERFDISDGCLPRIEGLADRLMHCRDEMLPLLSADVASILTGRLHFLSRYWPARATNSNIGVPADYWHLDPVSGSLWPGRDTYCFDISLNKQGMGDPKYSLELNRLQFLQPVAAFAALNQDVSAAKWILASLDSWIEYNPPFQGLNWLSGIQLALRVASVIVTLSLLPQDTINFGQRLRLRAFFAAHAHWIRRFPSLYSSANNHLAAEGMGLFLVGALMPDIPAASVYECNGRAICERQCQLLIDEEGMGREQSPTYAAFTVEMLLLAGLVARGIGRPFSPTFEERLRQFAKSVAWLADGLGLTPSIGDNDNSRVIATGLAVEQQYPSSIQAAVAGYFSAADLAPASRKRELRDVVFDAPLGRGNEPAGLRNFKSGYSVVKERRAGRKLHLVMDHGPVGYLSIAAHGHADALSIWLHLDDRPVLVDAGTYLYANAKWRDAFRATRAHNTLVVSGVSQSIPAGPFNWSHKAEVQNAQAAEGDTWSVIASHDGYRRDFGVIHQRCVYAKGNTIVIEDYIVPSRPDLPIEIGYLFHPNIVVARTSQGFIASADAMPICTIVPDISVTASIERDGPPGGSGGWYSPAFGIKKEASRLVLRGHAGLDLVTTVIALD